MGDLIEVCSLGVKPPYQPVGVLIQSALPGMIRAGKVDRCSRYFRYFLVLGKLRAVIGGQGFKLAERIGDDVPESGDHSLCTLVGQFANNNHLDGFIDHGQQE
ncbi:Uncharacterised protein [Yersinia pekkanenii]|uniref:Uncharacterized protein n=1 Tax=Yersinia pekkanenii TaxID=1288385 RepID=A0ABP1ZXF4_9GAMM|nr:Uncharacterised protein [Yersinia pekkanenii]